MGEKPGLRPQEAVGATLRAIARQILADARTAVEDRDRLQAVAIHDFRATMKSWRAFLRLIEPHLEAVDRGWRTEARDLARDLAGARDVQAAIDAANDAERHAASHRLSSQSWQTIRERLETLRDRAESTGLNTAMRARIAAAIERADARVGQWPLDAVTFSDIAQDLTVGYRRARKLLPQDWRAAGADQLHELRARVVVHRYQMEIVEPLWPRLGRTWVREAQKLRRRLGGHQDLVVMSRYIEPHQPLAHWRSRLQSVIAQRQVQHVEASRQIAARLFAERPKAFRQRLEAMWQGGAAGR